MKCTKQRGMTLMEILVVLVILGLLMAIVVPSINRHLEQARIGTAKTQMSNIGNAIMTFRMEKRRLPKSLDVLTEEDPILGEPILAVIPDDPWGAPYEYRILTRRKYEIRCLGIDGEPNTEDDLTHPVYVER